MISNAIVQLEMLGVEKLSVGRVQLRLCPRERAVSSLLVDKL